MCVQVLSIEQGAIDFAVGLTRAPAQHRQVAVGLLERDHADLNKPAVRIAVVYNRVVKDFVRVGGATVRAQDNERVLNCRGQQDRVGQRAANQRASIGVQVLKSFPNRLIRVTDRL